MREEDAKIIVMDYTRFVGEYAMRLNNAIKDNDKEAERWTMADFKRYFKMLIKANWFITGINVNNMLIESLNGRAAEWSKYKGQNDIFDKTVDIYYNFYETAIKLVREYEKEFAEEYGKEKSSGK